MWHYYNFSKLVKKGWRVLTGYTTRQNVTQKLHLQGKEKYSWKLKKTAKQKLLWQSTFIKRKPTSFTSLHPFVILLPEPWTIVLPIRIQTPGSNTHPEATTVMLYLGCSFPSIQVISALCHPSFLSKKEIL